MRMPGMSGIDLLQDAARQGLLALPAIVITGHGDVPLAVEAMKAGAVDFIEKPFEEEAILTAVRRALEQGSDENGDGIVVAAKLATLSERERQVLEGLVCRPSQQDHRSMGLASAPARSKSIAPI